MSSAMKMSGCGVGVILGIHQHLIGQFALTQTPPGACNNQLFSPRISNITWDTLHFILISATKTRIRCDNEVDHHIQINICRELLWGQHFRTAISGSCCATTALVTKKQCRRYSIMVFAVDQSHSQTPTGNSIVVTECVVVHHKHDMKTFDISLYSFAHDQR